MGVIVNKSVFNIAILGMNPRNTSTFAYFIKKHGADFLKVSAINDADVCIVDFDVQEGVKQWQLSQLNLKPAIILAATDPDKSNAIWVKKPVDTAAMTTAINALKELMHANNKGLLTVAQEVTEIALHADDLLKQNTAVLDETAKVKKSMGYQHDFKDLHSPSLNLSQKSIIHCCGLQVDADSSSPDFRKQVSYDPSLTLLASIAKARALAREKNRIVELRGGRESLVIMPGGESVFVDLDSHLIRHICAASLQTHPKIKVLAISLSECEQRYPSKHRNMHQVNTLLWQVALWSARGRLPNTIAPEQAVKILHWPNFTRLTITPHAIAITSILLKESLSPVDLAAQLQIPQRYVFAFIAAAASSGLIEQADVKSRPVKVSWRKPQGLLNSILRSLKAA